MFLRITEADERRFWPKVGLPDANGCMPWLAAKCQGYGKFRVNGMAWYAHRVMLFLAVGPPPTEVSEAAHEPQVCHRPDCVAPEHLRWATGTENQKDRIRDRTTGGNFKKLTDDQVAILRDHWQAGVSQAELSRWFGITRASVSQIVHGKRRA